MRSHRYHQIDFLRALACVVVVAFHYLYRGQKDGWVPFSGPDFLTSIVKFGYMGVQLFFVVSGFVIFLSAQGSSPRAFVASRAARLYPAFWASIILTTLAVHLGDLPSLLVPWRDVFINFSMLTHWFNAEYVDGAYWSLAVELHFYIMVWLLIRFKLMGYVKPLMLGWLALSLGNLVRPVFPLEFFLSVQWAPYFCVGICAFLMREGDRGAFVHVVFAAASLLAVAYSGAVVMRASDYSVADLVTVALITLAIVGIFWLISRDLFKVRGSPSLYWAATLTYPIYLLHEYIGYVMMTALWQAGLTVAGCLSVAALAVLLMSYAVHVKVELPLSRLIRRAVKGA